MPKKNDLSMFKAGPSAQAAEPKTILAPKKPGRKAKRPEDKASEIVALKFTKAELAKIEEKAGLVPKSTFLKHLLRENTDIFD